MSENLIKHVQVAVVGAGPAGIGAAIGLKKHGIESVLVLERSKEIGGIPALYKKKQKSIPTFALWTRGRMLVGEEYIQILQERLLKFAVDIKTECLVLKIDAKQKSLTIVTPGQGMQVISADAIIFACGSREKTLAERGWAVGARPERIYFTKHLLDLIDHNDRLPVKKPVILGSDLIAYAAAAKLKMAGAVEPIMADTFRRPQCSLPARLYFSKWSSPIYHGSVKSLEIRGVQLPSEVQLSNGSMIPCDGIVVSGELIPNSELALIGNLEVDLPSRKPIISGQYQLSEPGWFAAGNILGGFHGAGWCYYNGQKVAKSVLKYLSK